jgi:hypothetical protein
MYDTKKTKSGFYFEERLVAVTREMNEEKFYVITFLVLNCYSAVYGELLDDLYMDLFGSHTELFIKQLKKRGDWKRIVDRGTASMRQFVVVINNLGNSDFEKELKEYLFTRYPSIKYYVHKK